MSALTVAQSVLNCPEAKMQIRLVLLEEIQEMRKNAMTRVSSGKRLRPDALQVWTVKEHEGFVHGVTNKFAGFRCTGCWLLVKGN